MSNNCTKCVFYNSEIDLLRQEYVDVNKINGDNRTQHFCSMYNSNIPFDIWYDGKQCPFFTTK